MNIDYKNTKDFYKKHNIYDCTCIYCEFFKENIKDYNEKVASKIESFGIDIKKTFEIDLPYIDFRGYLIYPNVQYLIFGNCFTDKIANIDGTQISKAYYYPNPDIDEDYFVINVGPFIFDRIPEIIKNELKEENNGFI